MFSAEVVYKSWIPESGYVWVKSLKELNLKRSNRLDQNVMFEILESHFENQDVGVLTELSALDSSDAPRKYRSFDPFENNPVLYRIFASIPWRDTDAAVRFANQYGMLETDRTLKVPVKPLPDGVHIPDRKFTVLCDSDENWFVEAAMLRSLIRVWENLSDEEQLQKLFFWREGDDKRYTWFWNSHPDDWHSDPGTAAPSITDCILDGGNCPVLREWECVETIRGHEQEFFIRRECVPTRHWSGTETLKEVGQAFIRQQLAIRLGLPGQFSISIDPASGNNITFQVVPDNLLKGIFLQFGQAYQGNKIHRKCKTCGKWFENEPKDRGKREFCSDACKAKDYRNRKKEALYLIDQMSSVVRLVKQVMGNDLKDALDYADSVIKIAASTRLNDAADDEFANNLVQLALLNIAARTKTEPSTVQKWLESEIDVLADNLRSSPSADIAEAKTMLATKLEDLDKQYPEQRKDD